MSRFREYILPHIKTNHSPLKNEKTDRENRTAPTVSNYDDGP